MIELCQCGCRFENSKGDCRIKGSRCYSEISTDLDGIRAEKESLEAEICDLDSEIERLEDEIDTLESMY